MRPCPPDETAATLDCVRHGHTDVGYIWMNQEWPISQFPTKGGSLMDLAFYTPTDWNVVTSAGAEVDVGLSRFVFAGAEGAAFYLRQGTAGTVYRIPFFGRVVGGGLAASAGGVVTVSVSMPNQPSGGWRVYRNRIMCSSLRLNDFIGACAGIAPVGAAAVSGGASLVFFGSPLLGIAGIGGPIASLAAAAPLAYAAAVFWSTGQTCSAGISGSIFDGYTYPASEASQAEITSVF